MWIGGYGAVSGRNQHVGAGLKLTAIVRRLIDCMGGLHPVQSAVLALRNAFLSSARWV